MISAGDAAAAGGVASAAGSVPNATGDTTSGAGVVALGAKGRPVVPLLEVRYTDLRYSIPRTAQDANWPDCPKL